MTANKFSDCIGDKDVEIGTYLDDSETVKRKGVIT